MRIIMTHGYMLSGTGSNIYVQSLCRALVSEGHDVHLLCQEPDPLAYDFVAKSAKVDARGVEDLGEQETSYPGLCVVYQPEIGDLLPVYVYDDYPGWRVKTFLDLTQEELQNYLKRNVEALKTVLGVSGAEAVITNHSVPGPLIARRALEGSDLPYVSIVHGSCLQYVSRKSDKYMSLTREGLAPRNRRPRPGVHRRRLRRWCRPRAAARATRTRRSCRPRSAMEDAQLVGTARHRERPRSARDRVAYNDVRRAEHVTGVEVVRLRLEGDDDAVGANRRREAVATCRLVAGRIHGRDRRLPGDAITHVDLDRCRRHAHREVTRVGGKRDESAVGRERRIARALAARLVVRFAALGVDRYAPVVVSSARSRTNTSGRRFVSPSTSPASLEPNAT